MKNIRLSRLALALSIGALGGFVFDSLHLPLAWMLGAMSFNMVASLAGWPVAVPNILRTVTFAVTGVYLGSVFSPQALAMLGNWPWSLLAVLLFVILLTFASHLYYRRIAGFDPATALLSSTPGGLSLMVGLGAAVGGDQRYIALTQTLRIVIVVFMIPPLVTMFAHQPTTTATTANIFAIEQALLLVSGSALGMLIAMKLRLPAPHMTGAMFVSAALYGSGLVAIAFPKLLLFAALCVLGSAVGAQFAGTSLAEIKTVGKHALVSVVIMLILAALIATLVSEWSGVPFLAALLAFAPGGVSEMCLIAVIFGIDPTFVATHHVARIIFIMTVAPLVSKWAFQHNIEGSQRK